MVGQWQRRSQGPCLPLGNAAHPTSPSLSGRISCASFLSPQKGRSCHPCHLFTCQVPLGYLFSCLLLKKERGVVCRGGGAQVSVFPNLARAAGEVPPGWSGLVPWAAWVHLQQESHQSILRAVKLPRESSASWATEGFQQPNVTVMGSGES